MSLLLVHCTFPDRSSAMKLGRELVKRQLAACVSLGKVVTSIYPWENEICEEEEISVEIKTTEDRYEALEKALLELHPYDVPQIIAMPIANSLNAYRDWVVSNTRERNSAPGT